MRRYLGAGFVVVCAVLWIFACEPGTGADPWMFEDDAEPEGVGDTSERSDLGPEDADRTCGSDYSGGGELPEPWSDPDEDFVVTGPDNCPRTPNADQEDRDRDGIGDACDRNPDEACRDCGAVGAPCESEADCCSWPADLICREKDRRCARPCVPLGVACHEENSPCCSDSCGGNTGEPGGYCLE